MMVNETKEAAAKIEGLFNWVPFFREILSVICERYDKKTLKELYDKLGLDAYEDCKYMDPLTFVAYLNIGGEERRYRLCRKLKELLGLKSDAPKDFLGIPVFHNLNPVFFKDYSNHGDERALDTLWNFARELNDTGVSRDSFNNCIALNFVGMIKLSQFIFIVRAKDYFPCDLYTRRYLNIETSSTGDYEEYATFQRIANQASNGQSPFEISYRAWIAEHDGVLYSNRTIKAEADYALDLLDSLAIRLNNNITNNIYGLNKPQKKEDFLSRENYAKVLANFIKNRKTSTPLNIGICAGWGEGKSHLIGLLEKFLNEKAKDYQKDVQIVNFDAWRYNDQDKIWAAMIMEFLNECQRPFWRGAWFEIKYIVFQLRSACSMAKFAGILLTALLLTCILVIFPNIFVAGKILMYPWQWVILLALLIIVVPGFIQSPYFNIKSDFLKCLNLPTYENHVGFHSGVEKITRFALQHLSYGGKKKIVLFIDNLDRCSKENITCVLDSICQFLDICDDKNEKICAELISLLAIDYQIIQEAVISIKEILPERVDEYMDKIVDFPIFIPKAKDISVLAENALGLTEKEKLAVTASLQPQTSPDVESSKSSLSITEDRSMQEEEKSITEDSDITLLSAEEKIVLVKALSKLHSESAFAPRYIRKLMNLFIVFKALLQDTLVQDYKKYIWWFCFILRYNGNIDKDSIQNVRASINKMSETERMEGLYNDLTGSGSTVADYIASREFEIVFETSSIFIKPV